MAASYQGLKAIMRFLIRREQHSPGQIADSGRIGCEVAEETPVKVNPVQRIGLPMGKLLEYSERYNI